MSHIFQCWTLLLITALFGDLLNAKQEPDINGIQNHYPGYTIEFNYSLDVHDFKVSADKRWIGILGMKRKSWKSVVLILERRNGKQVFRLETDSSIHSLEFAPSSDEFAIAMAREQFPLYLDGINVYRLSGNKKHFFEKTNSIKLNRAHEEMHNQVSYQPSGRGFVVSTHEGKLKFYDRKSGKKTKEYFVRKGAFITGFTISPNGKYIAVLSGRDYEKNGAIALVYASTGKLIQLLKMKSWFKEFKEMRKAEFRPDGKALAAVGDSWEALDVWNLSFLDEKLAGKKLPLSLSVGKSLYQVFENQKKSDIQYLSENWVAAAVSRRDVFDLCYSPPGEPLNIKRWKRGIGIALISANTGKIFYLFELRALPDKFRFLREQRSLISLFIDLSVRKGEHTYLRTFLEVKNVEYPVF